MRIKRIWLLEIDFLINFFLLMTLSLMSKFVMAILLLPITDLFLYTFWVIYYFILNKLNNGDNMKRIILSHWKSIVSSTCILVLSLFTIINSDSFTSFGKFCSNLLVCLILSIPTWLVFYLECNLLYKFNNIDIRFILKKNNKFNKIILKWVITIIGLCVIVFASYYLMYVMRGIILIDIIRSLFLNHKKASFVVIDMIFCYIFIIVLLRKQISNNYFKVNKFIVVMNYICLFMFLLPLDLGKEMSNYNTYRSIILSFMFFLGIVPILLICNHLHSFIIRGSLQPLVLRHIITPSFLYIIVIFSYVSLIVVSYKLIPTCMPLSKCTGDSKFLDILNIIPLDIIQSSFVLLLLKIKDILKSKIEDSKVNHYILYTRNLRGKYIANQCNLLYLNHPSANWMLFMNKFYRK